MRAADERWHRHISCPPRICGMASDIWNDMAEDTNEYIGDVDADAAASPSEPASGSVHDDDVQRAHDTAARGAADARKRVMERLREHGDVDSSPAAQDDGATDVSDDADTVNPDVVPSIVGNGDALGDLGSIVPQISGGDGSGNLADGKKKDDAARTAKNAAKVAAFVITHIPQILGVILIINLIAGLATCAGGLGGGSNTAVTEDRSVTIPSIAIGDVAGDVGSLGTDDSGGGNYSGKGQGYADASADGKKVADAAHTTPPTPSGWCAAWVTNVFNNAGVSAPGGNACNMYYDYCHSTDWDNIKVGQIVACPSIIGGTPAGQKFGHVGIYVGDGKIMHSTGGAVVTDTIEDWIRKYAGGNYSYAGFGWVA